ncbi:hypothetical protein LWI28_017473 [Acer negundo]|uniref:Uncharacterized protein n=1 Tax=Acer negundo TaxID=4023 RepID=A0AAD5NKC1_ACENE|nr:hypothetical protein LWI28_017473 [Acer negundo]
MDIRWQELISRFTAACSGVSPDAIVAMLRDLLVTRGASLLADEANIASGAELKEARRDLARFKEATDTLIRSAAESERGRQEAIVDLERMKRALDISNPLAVGLSERSWSGRKLALWRRITSCRIQCLL